ncbi:MAG: DUF7332 family protein [Halorubrum sp.]
MTGVPRAALTALAVGLLVLSATVTGGAFVGGATAATPSDGPNGSAGDGDGVGPLTECFAGDGYPISIGETGASIEALVHISVLTDPAAGNEFGIEAAGTLDDEPIVTLAAGVRLTAREAVADGVDPFAAFDVLYAYDLRLPMFDGAIGDSEYSDRGSPITSGAGAVPC